MNVGEFYANFRSHLWENEYCRKLELPMNHLEKQLMLKDLNSLYTTEVDKMKYYHDLKMG